MLHIPVLVVQLDRGIDTILGNIVSMTEVPHEHLNAQTRVSSRPLLDQWYIVLKRDSYSS